MCNAILELVEDTLLEREQQGLQQGIQQGRWLMIIEQICQKINLQKSISEIAIALERDEEEIASIYHIAKDFSPDYPIDEIYRKWMETQ